VSKYDSAANLLEDLKPKKIETNATHLSIRE